MTKKLTLTVQEGVLKGAKKVAAEQGTSVSKLVNDYLIDLATRSSSDRSGKSKAGARRRTKSELVPTLPGEGPGELKPGVRRNRPEIGPITRELTGVIQAPADKDYKDLIAEAIEEKYGIKR